MLLFIFIYLFIFFVATHLVEQLRQLTSDDEVDDDAFQ